MSGARVDFGKDLRQHALTGDQQAIARWAHRFYLDRARELDDELRAAVMILIAMEEGPEFELSKEELLALAEKFSSLGG